MLAGSRDLLVDADPVSSGQCSAALPADDPSGLCRVSVLSKAHGD
jgi:hypothetical protein